MRRSCLVACSRLLQKTEINFYRGRHRHCFPVQVSGTEAPFLYCFNGLFVQPKAEWPDYADIARTALLVDYHVQHHGALELRFTSFFGVLRLDLVKERR